MLLTASFLPTVKIGPHWVLSYSIPAVLTMNVSNFGWRCNHVKNSRVVSWFSSYYRLAPNELVSFSVSAKLFHVTKIKLYYHMLQNKRPRCTYCNSTFCGSICHHSTTAIQRLYKTLSSQSVWACELSVLFMWINAVISHQSHCCLTLGVSQAWLPLSRWSWWWEVEAAAAGSSTCTARRWALQTHAQHVTFLSLRCIERWEKVVKYHKHDGFIHTNNTCKGC